MAINPSSNSTIGTRITAPDASYPQGSSKDETAPGARDGTPQFSERSNDIFGLQQALLKSASIVPTGNADTALVSQYMQAIIELASGRAVTYDDVGVADAYVLDVRTNQQAPASLFDGMIAVFPPLNPNGGASTVNVAGLGVKNIVDLSGNPLSPGVFTAGNRAELVYELGTDRFVHLNPPLFDVEVIYNAMLGNTIIPVYTEADIGVAVGGELTLADNTSYHIMAPIVTANTWILGNRTHLMDPGYTNNTLTFTGPKAFKVVDLVLVRISNLHIFGDGATQLFDFNSTVNGSLSMDRILFAGWGSLGNLNGISTAMQRITILTFAQGFTFSNGSLIGIDFSTFRTASDVTIFDISGTFSGAIVIGSVDTATGAAGFCIDVDAAFLGPIVSFRDIGLAGGTMFDPTGLDGTTPEIHAFGLEGVKSSEVVGIMSMSDNAAATTIVTQDVYVSIAGTTIAGVENERITHSANILTYIGLEPVAAKIHMVAASVTASGANLYTFGLFKNGVHVTNAHMSNELTSRTQTTPLEFIVSLVTGDTIEIKVKNTENTVNLTVSDFIVTLTA